jgi:RND family efflux transporter MFP subunit
MGYVSDVNVRQGDTVKQGQLLVVLDSRELDVAHRQATSALAEVKTAAAEADNAIAAARAGLDLAEATFRRMEDLFRKKTISNQELDEGSAKLRMARAAHEMALSRRAQVTERIQQAEQAVQSAEINRNWAQIRAPFAGTVTEKPVEPGVLATPGAPLLTIEQQAAYRFEAAVEESRIGTIRTGQRITVSIDSFDQDLSGQVSEIVPSVDVASRTFTVKIDLPRDTRLRSGLFGRARFPSGERRATVAPLAAVIERGQLQSVFVVDGKRANARLVTLGERLGDWVELLSGAAAGESVVQTPPSTLTDGATVEVRQ